jgi:hypothetical protein
LGQPACPLGPAPPAPVSETRYSNCTQSLTGSPVTTVAAAVFHPLSFSTTALFTFSQSVSSLFAAKEIVPVGPVKTWPV